MNDSRRSSGRNTDQEGVPHPSRNDWPEKFEKASVRRGRPPLAKTKVSTTIRLSREVIDHFKAGGRGWQSRIDEALREFIQKG